LETPKSPFPAKEKGEMETFYPVLLLLGCGFFSCSLGFLDILSAFATHLRPPI
jgi:hypothetical protein